MQLNKIFSPSYLCRYSILFMLAVALSATYSVSNAQQTNNSAQQRTLGATNQKAAPKKAKPYKFTSRVHLQKNSTRGYLIFQVELPKGSHIYSLTQKGELRPSKLTVSDSKQFRMLGQFAPDRPPEVIKNDPLFKQQVEKHKGVVQFFAPIEVASGLALDKLAPEITFDGQVCTTKDNLCMPIFGEKVKGKFAGYFERTARKPANGKATTPKSSNGSRRTDAPETKKANSYR